MSITVLMPTFNNYNYIKFAIDSILRQTYSNFELLILDDGSTDDTKDIINQYNDFRIRYIMKEHTGLWDTLNYGLKIAKHNLIARMDGDDISLPQRLCKQVNFLRLNPEIDVVSSWYAVFEKRINYVIKTTENSEDIKKRMLLHSEIVHPGLIYKRDKILSLGGYNKYKIEDFELWLRNLEFLSFYNIQEVLTLVRYRKNSNFNSNIKERNKEINSFLEIYQTKHYKQFGLNINVLKGWKEYFYGDKKNAREYFKKTKFNILKKPKIIFAYLLTYINYKNLEIIKNYRIKHRIKYFVEFFSLNNKNMRRYYNNIMFLSKNHH